MKINVFLNDSERKRLISHVTLDIKLEGLIPYRNFSAILVDVRALPRHSRHLQAEERIHLGE